MDTKNKINRFLKSFEIKNKNLFFYGIIYLNILFFVDYFITYKALKNGFFESNIFLNFVIQNIGTIDTLTLFFTLNILFSLILYYIYSKINDEKTILMYNILIVLLIFCEYFVVVYNMVLTQII